MIAAWPGLLQLRAGHLLLLLVFEIPNGVDDARVSRWDGVHLRQLMILAFGRFYFDVTVALAIRRMNVGAAASVAYELRILAETRHRLGLHAAPMVRAIAQTALIKRKTHNVITFAAGEIRSTTHREALPRTSTVVVCKYGTWAGRSWAWTLCNGGYFPTLILRSWP